MKKKLIGLIVVSPGVFADVHEKLTVDFLASKFGYDVIFLVPDRGKGAKTPDIEMNGLLWEIKSPSGKSSRTIENNLRLALRQSANIVLDLRRMDGRIPTKKLLNEVERQFTLARSIKHIIVITRQEEHIDFERVMSVFCN
jgi:UTP:GlnB (protein PII) uridylyltransferase